MATNLGPVDWGGAYDNEGHREFWIKFKVVCEPGEGPAAAAIAPGLPVQNGCYGSEWNFGADLGGVGDIDLWCWCMPKREIERDTTEPVASFFSNQYFHVTFHFSTRPPSMDLRRFANIPIMDPILEPQKVNGSWVKEKIEITIDRFGLPIHNSAWQVIRGPQVEFDKSRGNVTIVQNRLTLDLPLLNFLKDSLNSDWLWGCPPRSIKFTPGPWETKWYGACSFYYTRQLEFEIRMRLSQRQQTVGDVTVTTLLIVGDWDRDVLDEGTKVLKGHWGDAFGTAANNWVLDDINGAPPNPADPTHFIRFKDRQDENTNVVLDGSGKPAGAVTVIKVTSASVIITPLSDEFDEVFFTTDQPHKLQPGDQFRIFGVDPPWYNGYFTAIEVPDANNVITEAAPGIFWEDEPELNEYDSGGLLLNQKTATIPGQIHIEGYPDYDWALALGIPLDLQVL